VGVGGHVGDYPTARRGTGWGNPLL
jgi:hypothetical protein